MFVYVFKGYLQSHLANACSSLNSFIVIFLLQAGITLLLINLSNQTDFIISVRNSLTMRLHVEKKVQRESLLMRSLKRSVSWVGNEASEGATREEYHLTPKDGYLQSETMVLNGIPLELTENGDIPRLDPVHNNVNSPIYINPLSISFIVFPNFDAPSCE